MRSMILTPVRWIASMAADLASGLSTSLLRMIVSAFVSRLIRKMSMCGSGANLFSTSLRMTGVGLGLGRGGFWAKELVAEHKARNDATITNRTMSQQF